MDNTQNFQNRLKRNWVKDPTGKEVALVFLVWLTGITLVLLAGTDLFRETFFVSKNIIVGFLVLISTFFMLRLVFSFLKKN